MKLTRRGGKIIRKRASRQSSNSVEITNKHATTASAAAKGARAIRKGRDEAARQAAPPRKPRRSKR
jgi:hypothetical protein